MDDHKDILHAADLQPVPVPAAGAFGAVGLPVVDRIEKGSALSGRWFGLLQFGRIDFDEVAEPGW